MTHIRNGVFVALTVAFLLVLVNVFITSIYPPIAEHLDSRRYEVFETKCRQARESIYSKFKTEELDFEYFPKSGIQNETYEANSVVFQLMKPPQVVKKVQMFYVDNESIVRDCRGAFVDVIKDFDSIAYQKAELCKNKIKATSVTRAKVLVKLQRGALERDIRPIKFQLIDAKSNKVLAEQATFELLLGNMRSPKHRRWYGWGSAQGAISCKLSSPRELIVKVVGAASVQSSLGRSFTSKNAN